MYKKKREVNEAVFFMGMKNRLWYIYGVNALFYKNNDIFVIPITSS